MQLDHGTARFLHGVSLTGEHVGPVHLALAHPDGAREPWFVVSSCPPSLGRFTKYERRFRVEEHFLDDKSGGFGLEDSLIRDAGMLDRLMLILAISTLLRVSDGTVRVGAGERAAIDSHDRRSLSYCKIGWRGLRLALSWGRPILTALHVVGGPDPAPPRPHAAKRRTPALDALLHTTWTTAPFHKICPAVTREETSQRRRIHLRLCSLPQHGPGASPARGRLAPRSICPLCCASTHCRRCLNLS